MLLVTSGVFRLRNAKILPRAAADSFPLPDRVRGWRRPLPARIPPITFEEIAARAGVEFVLNSAATPQKRQIETMAGGWACSTTTTMAA
jgi:hypothetical protein